MVRKLLRFFGIIALLWSAQGLTAAQLRVGVYEMPPFAKPEGGVWTGLSIDIWEKVAALNKWDYQYQGFPDVDSALAAERNGQLDIIIAPVPITESAVKEVEFSQPYFRAGLQIMISNARRGSLDWLMENLMGWLAVPIFWVVVAAVVVMTVGVALFEWRHNPDFPKGRAEGLAEAFYYVVSLTLTGKSTYKGFSGVLGRLVLVFWMILGMVMVICLTSTITAAMTAERLQSGIHSPEDLAGKTIGAVKETRALEYLRERSIDTTVYPTLEEAVQGLLKGDVRALVGPAPALQYYDYNNPKIPITEVGRIFKPYNYGFAFPVGSERRLDVNAALLKIQETGVINELAEKYFGSVYQP